MQAVLQMIKGTILCGTGVLNRGSAHQGTLRPQPYHRTIHLIQTLPSS